MNIEEIQTLKVAAEMAILKHIGEIVGALVKVTGVDVDQIHVDTTHNQTIGDRVPHRVFVDVRLDMKI